MEDKNAVFNNRKEAAELLATQLMRFSGENAVVLGIPTGGAEVAFYVAKKIGARFSVLISKKLTDPEHPQITVGAVCEEGTVFIDQHAKSKIGEAEILRCRSEILRRVLLYREGKPLPQIKGQTVILVDDGIETGMTMTAALLLCVRHGAARVVVAAPVARTAFSEELKEADELVVLVQPPGFKTVSQAYQHFDELSESTIKSFMAQAIRAGDEH